MSPLLRCPADRTISVPVMDNNHLSLRQDVIPGTHDINSRNMPTQGTRILVRRPLCPPSRPEIESRFLAHNSQVAMEVRCHRVSMTSMAVADLHQARTNLRQVGQVARASLGLYPVAAVQVGDKQLPHGMKSGNGPTGALPLSGSLWICYTLASSLDPTAAFCLVWSMPSLLTPGASGAQPMVMSPVNMYHDACDWSLSTTPGQ